MGIKLGKTDIDRGEARIEGAARSVFRLGFAEPVLL